MNVLSRYRTIAMDESYHEAEPGQFYSRIQGNCAFHNYLFDRQPLMSSWDVSTRSRTRRTCLYRTSKNKAEEVTIVRVVLAPKPEVSLVIWIWMELSRRINRLQGEAGERRRRIYV